MSSTHWISDVMGFWRHTGIRGSSFAYSLQSPISRKATSAVQSGLRASFICRLLAGLFADLGGKRRPEMSFFPESVSKLMDDYFCWAGETCKSALVGISAHFDGEVNPYAGSPRCWLSIYFRVDLSFIPIQGLL
jgi:hypothetical protein